MGIAIRAIYQGGVFRPLNAAEGVTDNQVLELHIRPLTPVTSDPGIMGGKPCISGTRMPIDGIFQFLEHGYSLEQFLQLYPQYQRAQVESAVRYAIERMGYPALELA
ncbi:MAG: DUF433 domain-containing protein [Chloroflexi bacterium]|nr:DUF433 domain-containing protein [Chloroflexota bacterium]